jgi:hypothetical protein
MAITLEEMEGKFSISKEFHTPFLPMMIRQEY